MGVVEHLVVFERETFEVVINDLGSLFQVDKAIRLNLKDYKEDDKHVDLVKITTKDGISIIVLSETLSY